MKVSGYDTVTTLNPATDYTYAIQPDTTTPSGYAPKKLLIGKLSASTKVVYFSGMTGVQGDASLSDATLGTDDSTAIQAAIDAAPAGATFVVDGKFKVKNLKLRSGDTLQGFGGSYDPNAATYPATGIIQVSSSTLTDCVLRNVNWKSNYNGGTPVSDFSLVVDHDITVRDVFINNNCYGSHLNGSAIQFFGVRNLRLERVSIFNQSDNFGGILVGYVDGLLIDGAFFFAIDVYNYWAHGTVPNPVIPDAGIHVGGPMREVTIRNTRGWVSTAAIEIHTCVKDLTAQSTPGASILYGGDATTYVLVENTNMTFCGTHVEVRGGNNIGVSTTMDRLMVNGVRGEAETSEGETVYIGNQADAGMTAFTFTIKQAYVDRHAIRPAIDNAAGTHDPALVRIQNRGSGAVTINQLMVNNWLYDRPLGTVLTNTNALITFDCLNTVTVDELSIVGASIHDASADTLRLINAQITAGSGKTLTIGTISVSDVQWVRSQGTIGGILVDISGTSGGATTAVGVVTLNNVVLDGVQNAVVWGANSTLQEVVTSGLTHRNASSNESISVGSGLVLPRLRCAASNLRTLTGGAGSIAYSKTDSTEDNIKDLILAYWKMGEVNGASRASSVDSNYVLTNNNGATQVAGKVGNATNFASASSQSLSVASDSVLVSDFNRSFTIAGWVRLTTKSADMGIVGKGGEYALRYFQSGDRFRFYGNSNGGANYDALGSPSTATWYFFVCGFDAITKKQFFSINNGTMAEQLLTAGGTSSNAFEIGKNTAQGGWFLNGDVDAVGYWKRRLAQWEIDYLYNSGSGIELY